MHLNKLLSDFWNRWQTEYLMELRDGHRYVGKTSNENPVHVGDVLVHDTKPGGFWELARITQLVSGQDGRVRGAILKVASPGKKPQTLKRPLQCLCPLKVPHLSMEERAEGTICESEPETQTPIDENCETVEQNGRPLRSADKKARDSFRAIAFHEQESDQD